jgi:hypothetical protein
MKGETGERISLHSYTYHNRSTEAVGPCVTLCKFLCFCDTLQLE